MVDGADIVVALNPPSLARFEELLVPGWPARRQLDADRGIATAAGDERLVSVVALGAVIARRAIVSEASVERALTEMVGRKRPELVAANLVALAAGRDAAIAVRAA
jgi:Pyruvate/2-oxoacid:ferredoxin oxidoreductase gamma subunit